MIADAYPANHLPSWNPGVRLAPFDHQPADRAASIDGRGATGTIDVMDLSRPAGERTRLQVLVSLAGAAGIALMVPLVILLIGLPFALVLRGLLAAIAWVFGIATL